MSHDFLTIEFYPKVDEIIRSVFDVERRLPDYVFKKKYKFTLLTNFNLECDIIKIIRDSHFCSVGEKILLSVIDPDPIAYFHKHFNKISSFCFDTTVTEKEYGAILHRSPGNPADAIAGRADTMVWVPEHRRWAMWGEHGCEIAVIGFDDPAQAEALLRENIYWMDAETALEDFASAPYRDHKAPEDFARALIENYGSREDLQTKLEAAGVRLKLSI